MSDWYSELKNNANTTLGSVSAKANEYATSAQNAVQDTVDAQLDQMMNDIKEIESEVPALTAEELKDPKKVEKRNKEIKKMVKAKMKQQLNGFSTKLKSSLQSTTANARSITTGLLSTFDSKMNDLKPQLNEILSEAEAQAKEKSEDPNQPVDPQQMLNEIVNITKGKITELVSNFQTNINESASTGMQLGNESSYTANPFAGQKQPYELKTNEEKIRGWGGKRKTSRKGRKSKKRKQKHSKKRKGRKSKKGNRIRRRD